MSYTGIPAGVIFPYGGATAPAGWLLCDGTSYLRADYPALFTAISTAFGTADGTHFNVPDFRGRFLRGVDGGQARDPDRASRTAMATGGATGDNIGSVQAEAFKSHNHGTNTGSGGSHDHEYQGYASPPTNDLYQPTWALARNSASNPGSMGKVAASGTHTHTVTSDGGNESRPINANVNYIIKI